MLKNGRRVAAEQIVEEESRVVYETAWGKFSLAKSLVDPGVLAASNKSNAATIDDTRDDLLSRRQKLRDIWRRFFLQ